MSYPTPGDEFISEYDVRIAVRELEREEEAYREDVEEAEEALEDAKSELEDLNTELADALAEDVEDFDADAVERLKGAIVDKETEIACLEATLKESQQELSEWRDENGELLEQLRDLADMISQDDYLIHEDSFTEYAREQVEEIGGKIPDYVVVDWEATAHNLLMDYSEVEFGGETYYYR